MPRRKTPLVTGEYYHVFNRSINKEPIFAYIKNCERAIKTLDYYKFLNPPIKLSTFLSLGVDRREEIKKALTKLPKLAEIVTYCLMPNHYHLLLKQSQDNGISKFLSLFQNSYTRYFNTRHDREGHLLKGQFKSVRVEDEEQLLHLHRYILLNPYSSFVVKSLDDLKAYPFSSLPEYLSKKDGISSKEIILSHFQSIKLFEKFILNQADYQKRLKLIKHLTFE